MPVKIDHLLVPTIVKEEEEETSWKMGITQMIKT